MPYRSPARKSLILSTICLLASCAPAPQDRVYCHGFTKDEKLALKQQVLVIPFGSPLDAAFRDYESICAKLEKQL